MRQKLSREDLLTNLKVLVFKHSEQSDENLHALFELAKSMHDLSTIKRLALECNMLDAIKYIENTGSDQNGADLIELIIKGSGYDSIQDAIEQGAYVNKKDRAGNTALVKAAILNEVDIVKLLLKHDADVHIKLKNGKRLVENVFQLGYGEVLDLLISHGADDLYEEYVTNFFYEVNKHITSSFVAKQFVYEELDAARHGNDDAVHFVNKSGVKEELYTNAMQRSLPEVDGASGPQQTLLFKCIMPIMNEDNRDLITKVRILTVEKIMSEYRLGKYENKILKLTLENSATILIQNGFAMIEGERFEKITEGRYYNPSRQIYLDLLNNAVKFSLKAYNEDDMKEEYFAVVQQEEILKYDARHNPKRLVEILNYFTKDNPIKYTAHSFDWNRYDTYENFMMEVKKTFESIDDDLKFLSPNLHEKITKFLFSDNLNESNTWGMSRIAFGWSSPELAQWAREEEFKHDGKKAIYFPLPSKYTKHVHGKTISNFDDVCNMFKNEIEIRDDGKLSMLLEDLEEEVLGYDFEVEYKNLANISFYTDVEYLKNGLEKIFEQFKVDTRKDYNSIVIKAVSGENGKYIDLFITQIGSEATKSPDVLVKEIDDGDFQDIRSSFLSLCNWSVLGKYQEKNFKIDYLSSDTEKINVSHPSSVPEGFSHQLRFYHA